MMVVQQVVPEKRHTEEISMSLGWFKKLIIESTTKDIISGIVQEVDATLRISPGLTLEEALRLVNKRRPIRISEEENISTDLHSLFAMMVFKAYRYKRAFDQDAYSQEHTELVLKIAYDYMNMVVSKTKDDYESLTTYDEKQQDSRPKNSKSADACTDPETGENMQRLKKMRNVADQGDTVAQYNLGLMYFTGDGVVKNYIEAVKWIMKAAEQGHADAQYLLGTIYFTGKGVTKNNSEAIKWFKKAAEQGHQVANEALRTQ